MWEYDQFVSTPETGRLSRVQEAFFLGGNLVSDRWQQKIIIIIRKDQNQLRWPSFHHPAGSFQNLNKMQALAFTKNWFLNCGLLNYCKDSVI